MSWHPNDLVSDTDLIAYEANILTQFARVDWQDKRIKALEDWLGPILRTQGFNLERLRTRYEADSVLGFTATAYTDFTDAAKSTSTDDVNLAGIFVTPASDALYIGSTNPFRGISIRVLDSASTAAGAMSVAYWADYWSPLTITDGTVKVPAKTLSGGGPVTWTVPPGWVRRALNASSTRYYFARVMVSALPTGATAGQIGVIRRSALCSAVTFRTLELIFREAPSSGSGPWSAKADYYNTEADAALQRALQIIGGEFETDDPATDLISEEESEQVASEVSFGPFRQERR